MRYWLILVAACAALACGGPAHHGTSPGGSSAERSAETPGRAIVGRVIDKVTGKSLGFANVRATQGDNPAAASDMTGADGAFRLELEPGTYTVVVTSGTRFAHYNGVVVLPDRNTTLNFELDVPMTGNDGPVTGSIEGLVIDKLTREPFPGAVISAHSPALRDAQMAMADEHGVYRFEQLPPGTYVVSVYYHLIDKGNIEIRRSGVIVVRGSSERVNLEIDTRIKR